MLKGTFIHCKSEALLFPRRRRNLAQYSSTPPLHYSSTLLKNHATAEPSLSDPRKAGSSTVPEGQVFKSE